MKKLIFILIICVCCNLSLFGQTEVSGTYQISRTTLTLKEDGSAVETFQGGLMRYVSRGNWSFENKKLIIVFDSVAISAQRKKEIYIIKRNKLRKIPFTKEDYEDFTKRSIIHNEANKIKPHYTYEKFLKKCNTIRKYDLKKVKKSTND